MLKLIIVSLFILLIQFAFTQKLDWKTQDSLLNFCGTQSDSVKRMSGLQILKFEMNRPDSNDSSLILPRKYECHIKDSTLAMVNFDYISTSTRNRDQSFHSNRYSLTIIIVNHEVRDYHESKNSFINRPIKNNNLDTLDVELIEKSSVHIVLYKNQLIFQMSNGHDLGTEETFNAQSYALESYEYAMEEIRKKYPWIK